ncbi:MAG: hypothetical protein JWM53_1164 [bacterium]|nr:hypothetical protein [bacterium]
MHNVQDGTTRETYEPPTVEDVPIRPEEQLLASCKTNFAPGVDTGICNTCVGVLGS